MSSRITLEHIKTDKGKAWAQANSEASVLIFSGQHGAYWREGAKGYTYQREDAGRYTLSGALAVSDHAGPEKQISYELL